MDKKEEILNELRAISPFLAEMEQVNPYTLPDGYFEALPDRITEKILLTASLQPGFANTNCYQVPGGYFDHLSGKILSAIKMAEQANEVTAELTSVAPLLNTISKEHVYNVPEGYFEREIAGSSLQPKKKGAGVFSIRSVKRWMQYAAAAVVAGILVTGAFLFTDDRGDEYIEFEKYNQVDIPTELNKVSEEELLKYLDNPEHSAIMPSVNLSAAEVELFNMNSSMQTISDEELKQYLNENTELSDSVGSDKIE